MSQNLNFSISNTNMNDNALTFIKDNKRRIALKENREEMLKGCNYI